VTEEEIARLLVVAGSALDTAQTALSAVAAAFHLDPLPDSYPDPQPAPSSLSGSEDPDLCLHPAHPQDLHLPVGLRVCGWCGANLRE
jgi:hypothetical protein